MIKFLFSLPKRLKNFLVAVIEELKFVEWISLKETIRFTAIVTSTTIIFALSLAASDRFFNVVISKLLEVIQ